MGKSQDQISNSEFGRRRWLKLGLTSAVAQERQ